MLKCSPNKNSQSDMSIIINSIHLMYMCRHTYTLGNGHIKVLIYFECFSKYPSCVIEVIVIII